MIVNLLSSFPEGILKSHLAVTGLQKKKTMLRSGKRGKLRFGVMSCECNATQLERKESG